MDIVGNKTLRSLWDDLAAAHGEKTALVFEDAEGNTREYSYQGLNSEINRAANAFLALGLGKGDVVALQMCNSPELVICWYGLAKIGAVMAPINTQYVAGECEYIVDKCGARTVIAEEGYLQTFLKLNEDGARSFKTLIAARLEAEREVPGAFNLTKLMRGQSPELASDIPLVSGDPAEILFTSGTTDRPKGALLTHHNLIFSGHYTIWLLSMRPDDRYLTMMPGFHIDFQCSAAMPTFMVGGTLLVLERYSARRFWSQICLHRATLTECIPLMVRTLMLQPRRSWERGHCLREVFFCLTITDQEKRDFEERFGVTMLNSYGMTETLVGLTGDLPGEKRIWPSIGKAGLEYQAKIVNEAGVEMPARSIGEILVKGVPGKTIFKEYYRDPEATAKALSPDGWLRTGDNGWMDENGVFYFVDRDVDMIKRSGENISSTEIESLLNSHPKIAESAVIGVPDTIRDEAVKAFVMLKKGETLTPEEIIAYCAERMARFKVPSCVELCDSFPRTCTGKVQKKGLKGCKND
jgi:crotonobetaine/carnitine-CoA ligase